MIGEPSEKKGVSRFLSFIFGELRRLVAVNLLFCACALPSAATFALGLFGIYSRVSLPLSIALAFPIGGAVAACYFCITMILRDEPGYVWHDFWRKFKENAKQAALPGILCTAFIYAQAYLWGPFLYGGSVMDAGWMIVGVVMLVVFGMVAPFVFLQIAYIELKTKKIIINSLLLAFAHAPRSFMGAIMGGAIWVAFFLLMPGSLVAVPVILLLGFSVSWLLDLMWIWPLVDRQFNINETLRERKR